VAGGSGNAQNCNLCDYGCNQTPEPHSNGVFYLCLFLMHWQTLVHHDAGMIL